MSGTTIGVLINEVDGAYQTQWLKGIKVSAEELGLHVLCFPGRTLATNHTIVREFHVLFHLATLYKMDGVVSATGTFASNLSKDALCQFFDKFGDTPIISVGEATANVPAVQPDNRKGMTELVDHFIHHHRFEQIAFISGPANNSDARERLDVFRERHAHAGIQIDESLILNGSFDRASGRQAVLKLLARGKLPRAIISANDEMAATAIAALLEHGVRIPDDVAIAGFDDLTSVLQQGPPLTSVRQETRYQATLALRMLVARIRGEDVPLHTLVPTRAITRYSCGCSGLTCSATTSSLWDLPETAASELEMLRQALIAELSGEEGHFQNVLAKLSGQAAALRSSLGDLRTILLVLYKEATAKDFPSAFDMGKAANLLFGAQLWLTEQERMYIADKVLEGAFPAWLPPNVLLTGLAGSTFTLGKMLMFLRDTLITTGARNTYIVLFPRLAHMHQWDNCELPEEGQLVLAIRDGVALPTADMDRFPIKDLLPFPIFHEPGAALYTVLPLFQQQEHYGYMILDLECDYGLRIEQLREVVSNLVFSTFVFGELDRARQLLRQDLDKAEENYQQLSALSERDELTGLLNRRGFFTQATALRQESAHPLMLISADMDGLKQINDTWGHAAGDQAINSLATVLRSTFRAGDLVARFGGDEFVILSNSFLPEAETQIRNRIAERLAQHNATHEAEWKLSISLGFSTVPKDKDIIFDDCLAHADRLLYQEKRERKASGVPEQGASKHAAKLKSADLT